MSKKQLQRIVVIVTLASVLIGTTLPVVEARSVFRTDNQLLMTKPGWGVNQWMWANIIATRSGSNVYVDEYYFTLWHYQYKQIASIPTFKIPGLSIPITYIQFLNKITVTFSGDGIPTATFDVYRYGSVRPINQWPSWMRVTHLYHSEGDPLTVEFTVHIDIDRTFLEAEATMTVRAVGYTYTPFYQPFDCTYCVSCSAYIDYY